MWPRVQASEPAGPSGAPWSMPVSSSTATSIATSPRSFASASQDASGSHPVSLQTNAVRPRSVTRKTHGCSSSQWSAANVRTRAPQSGSSKASNGRNSWNASRDCSSFLPRGSLFPSQNSRSMRRRVGAVPWIVRISSSAGTAAKPREW